MIKASAGGGGKGLRVARRRHARPARASPRCQQRGASELRRRPRLHREVHRGAAPHRDPGARRRARQRRLPVRARVLDPAPPPEGDRGGAVAVPRRATRQGDGRAGGGARQGGEVPVRRHGRVRRRRRPQLLLPRDEHAPAGRAPGDRDDHRARPRRADDPRRRRREARRSRRRRSRCDGWAIEAASTPRTRCATSCRRPGGSSSSARRRSATGEVRVDTGVYEGGEMSMHYDSMIAKLIVHGTTATRRGRGSPRRSTPSWSAASRRTSRSRRRSRGIRGSRPGLQHRLHRRGVPAAATHRRGADRGPEPLRRRRRGGALALRRALGADRRPGAAATSATSATRASCICAARRYPVRVRSDPGRPGSVPRRATRSPSSPTGSSASRCFTRHAERQARSTSRSSAPACKYRLDARRRRRSTLLVLTEHAREDAGADAGQAAAGPLAVPAVADARAAHRARGQARPGGQGRREAGGDRGDEDGERAARRERRRGRRSCSRKAGDSLAVDQPILEFR